MDTTKQPRSTWLTPAEAAAELQASVDLVYTMLAEGLPHLKCGRFIRIRRDDWEGWLDARRTIRRVAPITNQGGSARSRASAATRIDPRAREAARKACDSLRA